MVKLVVFDLDGTLAESKSPIDTEMSALLRELLIVVKVAVISGGNWPQFEKQFLSNLPHDEILNNLSLLPTCGTKFYRYSGAWTELYSEDLTSAEKQQITDAIIKAAKDTGLNAAQVWGPTIEDRDTQITFSALGQQAPIEEKEKWDPDYAKRTKIKALLDRALPSYSIRMGGTTSIDITHEGIDKAYGIRKLRDVLQVSIDDMLFVGDAIFPGGNDYPAKEAGAPSVRVRGPNETKRVVEAVIACLGPERPT